MGWLDQNSMPTSMPVMNFCIFSFEDGAGKYETKSWLERVVIVGLPNGFNSAEISSPGEHLFEALYL